MLKAMFCELHFIIQYNLHNALSRVIFKECNKLKIKPQHHYFILLSVFLDNITNEKA